MTQAALPSHHPAIDAGEWVLDAPASTARFSLRNWGWNRVHGTIPLSNGRVQVGPNATILSAHVELDLAGIDTGNVRRDRDLARPQLLDTGASPILAVRAGSAERHRDGGWTLPATVSAVHGLAELPLTVTIAEHLGPDRLKVEVSGRMDRAGLGIKVPRFVIGRFVGVEVSAIYQRR